MNGKSYGRYSRFFIEPFVARDGDTHYMVRDANWITDAEVGMGKRSPTVAMFGYETDAQEWCEQVEAGTFDSVPHEANFEGWPELKERVQEWMTQKAKFSK